ncbi:hypothetical protein LRH25_27665 [Ideonella azotifigens]|uniref:Uncharacterized protein n=1 Tax=Ideonella azotifigens TaxID=513160 RepID=A0ABN1KB70_9BURK|nr:hypothetical protein [Ideonella azotifigens]MCD2344107.1 hypothetical protein [Ideonella azotifigens]
MAYAYCPRCDRSFRYSTDAPEGPSWLKELARAIGRGDQALALCFGCWRLPRVGDEVQVLHPPYDLLDRVQRGSSGQVIEIVATPEGVTCYLVQSPLDAMGESIWTAVFRRHQIKLMNAEEGRTLRLRLPGSEMS